ncbi:unnamed protein product, partial [marine sediment metagenome]
SKEAKAQDWVNAFSLIFSILGIYRGIGIQMYDLQTHAYGLLSADGQWEKNAYLVRNSFCAINQLPTDVFYLKNRMIGFRNVTKEVLQFDDLKIEIKPISAPKYARGIVIKTGGSIVICGIGFEVTIDSRLCESTKIKKIERGCWINNKYIFLGSPKPGSFEIRNDIVKIKMDEDDFSPPDIFNPAKNQYYIKISLN